MIHNIYNAVVSAFEDRRELLVRQTMCLSIDLPKSYGVIAEKVSAPSLSIADSTDTEYPWWAMLSVSNLTRPHQRPIDRNVSMQ